MSVQVVLHVPYFFLGFTTELFTFFEPEDVQSAAEVNEADDDEDQFENDFFNMFLEDDASGFIYGTYEYVVHVDKYCTRSEYRQPTMSGLEWVERKLGHTNACYKIFGMSPTIFYRLHDLLVEKYGLTSSPMFSSVEALGMLL
jgi:hypothetical protein